MSPLSSDLRNILERAVVKARAAAEEAATVALKTLAVMNDEPFAFMNAEQRRLRNALRAKARQLGNGDLKKGEQPLIEEVAYEQWHNRLFARFLAENSLLMHPEGVAVTLDECAELAAEMENVDAWQLAVRYASAMLPGIFRIDDPAMQIQFSPEGRHQLEYIISELPAPLFITNDALGWVYQFWQTKKKEEVNKSGRRIGGSDISPVTQLFTEHYMVQFLLENSLGAWWAVRHPTSPLLKQYTYLRYNEDGIPAAGTFSGWPDNIADVTIMDPCCGSGHFLVAAFEMLLQMRMEEEGLTESQATDAVLLDNLFGLELDPRCTQIAAFALTLSAWKIGGYRQLPLPNIACSGIAVVGQLETWTKLAAHDDNLSMTLENYYRLFRNAPDLGSLINPNDSPLQQRMFVSDYLQVEPLLIQALEKEHNRNDPVSAIFGYAAEGVAKAARLLADTYTLVVTNVPYLGLKKQDDILKNFCEDHYPDAKMDLATVFIERCRTFVSPNGSYAIVTPQTWLFLGAYRKVRISILRHQTWNNISRLGSHAFNTIGGEVVKVALLILTNTSPMDDHVVTGIDASAVNEIHEKDTLLRKGVLEYIQQKHILQNPDSRVAFSSANTSTLLEQYTVSSSGMLTGDRSRFYRYFWEVEEVGIDWEFSQSSVDETIPYGGRSHIVFYQKAQGELYKLAQSLKHLNHAVQNWQRGQNVWGSFGVAVSIMGKLSCSLYTGNIFDNNIVVIIPKDPANLPSLWAFCSSVEFSQTVRQFNQKVSVDPKYLTNIPFDLSIWQGKAIEIGPLPPPTSNDPTQWIFNGNPANLTEPLQIAVARLLTYSWPQQKQNMLDTYNSKGYIICLPSVSGESTAVERLRILLAKAFGDAWSTTLQDQLLQNVGFGGKSLEVWLRDSFFAQHCRLFNNRPFIWHIWDGRKDGFSALVNYHHLDTTGLDRLIYTYLGSWISKQRDERDAKVPGAEARLVAALELQKKLEAIRDGEPPYDIYVRWKPLHQQPIGWDPDFNDGVRINIRPFVEAGVLRTSFTINWNKDRGTNPDGSERLNDLHYTLAQKYEARAALQ